MSSCDTLVAERTSRRRATEETATFRLSTFRAPDQPATCARFVAGHREALARHAVLDIDAADEKWTSNPNVFVVVGEEVAAGALVAGVRIHLAHRRYPLPIEDSVGEHDSRLYDKIYKGRSGRTGEICGLWRSPTTQLKGLIKDLAIAVIALTHGLGVQRVWGLAPAHTLQFWQSLGYQVDRSLGDRGEFPYPDARYVSRVVRLDTGQIGNLPPDVRRRIAGQPPF